VGERGEHDNIVNAPLSAGDGGDAFREAFETAILPRLRDFRPDILVISAGFDAHTRDPLANLNLLEADYSWVTKKLMEIADDDERVDATLSMVLGQLASQDEWTRTQGLGELRWMTEKLPGLLTASRRARIVTAQRVATDPKVAAGIAETLRRLQAIDSGLRPPPAKEQSRP